MVQPVNESFSEEVLKAQEGKTVPLRLEIGGPIIGEATLKFDEGHNALTAEFHVDNPHVAEFLNQTAPGYIFGEPDVG